jgi:hypothetical protein
VTNASGNAACSLLVSVALGPQPLSAEFAGDAFYLPSSDTGKQSIVFAFPARGAFVLGSQTAAGAGPATSVTWWSYSWTAANDLAGGDPDASFKGFAGSLGTSPPACGGAWTSSPGNSPPPAGSVPSYMGVLVAASIAKTGSTFSGDTVKIVVVRTQPGYEAELRPPGDGHHRGHVLSVMGSRQLRQWSRRGHGGTGRPAPIPAHSVVAASSLRANSDTR